MDDPKKNTEENLDKRAEELLALDETVLKELGEAGKKRREASEEAEVQAIMEKHHVC